MAPTDLNEMNEVSIDAVLDRPQWFAICTNPKQEERAYHNLHAMSVECFNPRIRECRRNQFTGAVTLIPRSLFPRYIFARFTANSLLSKVRFTRGVRKVVSFDSKPAPINSDVIETMQSRVGNDGFINVGEPLKPGDKVRVREGPWKALVGVIERDIPANERVQILLTAVNYQGSLVIEREWVEKAG
jgi:transcriptional antiterminator RfaH